MKIRIAIEIIEGLVILFASWKIFELYTGRTNYKEEKEIKRKKLVDKFGWIFVIAIAVGVISGIGLILAALIRLA